jgi:hypothetical protein
MAVLTGVAQLPSDWPSAGNPNLSADGYAVTGIYWPYATRESPSPLWGNRNYTANVSVPAQRALAGVRQQSYMDDFYYRVHITPGALALGNVISTQIAQISLWNAWLVQRTLNSVSGLDEGLALSGQPTPPLVYEPTQERIYNLSIGVDGPAVLDALVQWIFDSGESQDLAITGVRIIPWGFVPTWSDPIIERLIWATDILQSSSAAEQRRALRLSPRRELEAQVLVVGRERQLLDMQLFSWSGRNWALPLWQFIQLTSAALSSGAVRINCATANRDFRVGGLVLLRGADAFTVEAAEILAIDAGGLDLTRPLQQAWPVRSRLYPAVPARFIEQPQLVRETDQFDSLGVRFRVTDTNDWPAALPATLYRGYPVLEERPNESQDLTHAWQRLLLELDNGSGIPQAVDTAKRGIQIREHRWLLSGLAQQAAHRSLLYGLQGRLAAVWVPTHADDITLTADITAALMDIANIAYSRFGVTAAGAGAPGRRDVRIELYSGVVYHRRITGATALSADVERLTLDTSLGVTVTLAQVRRICWLQLCRLDQDSIEIAHHTDAEGVAESQAIFRAVRDEEFA